MSRAQILLLAELLFLWGIAAATWGLGIISIIPGAVLVLAVFCWFLSQWRHAWLLFILAVIVGVFYYHVRLQLHERENAAGGFRGEFSAIVAEDPLLYEKYQRMTVRLKSPLYGEAAFLLSRGTQMRYGDVLAVKGELQAPQHDFDLPTAAFPEKVEIIGYEASPLKRPLFAFKHFLIGSIQEVLPQQPAALLAGVLMGWQGDFTNAFKEAMRHSGTTHLVALSGYNIALVVVSLTALLRSFFSIKTSFWLTAGGIMLFVIMVGGQASVVRAAIMGIMVLAAQALGRGYSGIHAMVATAAVMVAISPGIMRFDYGFQLSFLSLVGMIYLSPLFLDLLRATENKGFLQWRENLATTSSAQLAVLPVLLWHFGQFSFSALAANVLVLACMPLTMMLGFVLLIVSKVPILAWMVAVPLRFLLEYEIGVISLFAWLRIPIALSVGSLIIVGAIWLGLIASVLKNHRPKRL